MNVKSPLPTTRFSLICRLPDLQDAEAWDQFVHLYQPLIFRLARSKGFQDADAYEIVQEVLVAVARAVDRWDPDREKGRFRDWLFRIARNMMIKYLNRRRDKSIGSGDSAVARLLDQEPQRSVNEDAIFELEFRREVFRLAAEQVRKEVRETTWQAFWMSNVENVSTAVVARQLHMTTGAVHIACSRVRARIRDAVAQLDLKRGAD